MKSKYAQAHRNLDIHLDVHLTAHLDVHLEVHLEVHLDVHLDAHLDVHLGIHLDIHLDVHLDVHLDIHLDIHLVRVRVRPELAFFDDRFHPRSRILISNVGRTNSAGIGKICHNPWDYET